MGKGDKGYKIGFPTPDTYYQSSLEDDTTVARTITLDHEYIVLDALGQETILNLTINDDIEIGAEIWLDSSCGDTAHDIKLGDGTDKSVITGVVNKTQHSLLKYNGSQYNLFSVFQDNQMAVTSANVGTAASGVTAVEYGDKYNHVTVLTVNTTITTIAKGLHDYGVLVYTLPTSAQAIKTSYMSMALTSAATDIEEDTPEVGLGTDMASGAQGVLTSTDEDILTGQAATNCKGTATVKTIVPNLGIDKGTSVDHTVYFNFADEWTSGGDTGCGIAGTIVLEWINMA